MEETDDAAAVAPESKPSDRPHVAWEVFGVLGSVAILSAYFGLTNDWLVEGPLFHSLNLGGAIGVGAVCLKKHAWSPLVLEVVWAGVAVFGLVQA